jgi:hypothetical protein
MKTSLYVFNAVACTVGAAFTLLACRTQTQQALIAQTAADW